MKQIEIIAIVGSLRKESLNRQLALFAQELIGDTANFKILEYNDVPLMNQDIEFPPPEAVKRVRDTIIAADAVWFFTPEYNHFFPGVLKNLIDWLSRPVSKDEPQVLSGKPAAISGISPSTAGTMLAQDHLVTLISFLNMDVMNKPRVTVPNAAQLVNSDNKLELRDSIKYLKMQTEAFLDFIKKSI